MGCLWAFIPSINSLNICALICITRQSDQHDQDLAEAGAPTDQVLWWCLPRFLWLVSQRYPLMRDALITMYGYPIFDFSPKRDLSMRSRMHERHIKPFAYCWWWHNTARTDLTPGRSLCEIWFSTQSDIFYTCCTNMGLSPCITIEYRYFFLTVIFKSCRHIIYTYHLNLKTRRIIQSLSFSEYYHRRPNTREEYDFLNHMDPGNEEFVFWGVTVKMACRVL